MKIGGRVLVNLGAITLNEAVIMRIGDKKQAFEVQIETGAGEGTTSKYWVSLDKIVDSLEKQTQVVPVT